MPRKRARPHGQSAPAPGTIGARIRQLRDLKGWTQYDLEQASGIGQNEISRYELGQVKVPQEHTLIALAEALGVPPSELFEHSHFPDVVMLHPELRRRANDLPVQEQLMLARVAASMKEDGLDIKTLTALLERFIAKMEPPQA